MLHLTDDSPVWTDTYKVLISQDMIAVGGRRSRGGIFGEAL